MDRGAWALQRLSLRYCVADATSRGMRDFILGLALGAGPSSSSSSSATASALHAAAAARAAAARAAAAAAAGLAPTTLAAFAAANPQLAIEARVHVNRAPLAVGEYADGSRRVVDCKNKSCAEVATALQRLRDSASGIGHTYTRPVSTRVPSVQGAWDPSVTYEGFSMREARGTLEQLLAVAATAAAAAPSATPASTAPLAAASGTPPSFPAPAPAPPPQS